MRHEGGASIPPVPGGEHPRLMASLLMAIWIPLLFAAPVAGQVPPSPSMRSRPQQLPLSGSVSASRGNVDARNSSIQVQGAFQGSIPTGAPTKDPLPLSLDEAIRRGLTYNLGAIGAEQTEREARARRLQALAQLLPDLNGFISGTVQQTNLAAIGFSPSTFPDIPFRRSVIGPFHFFEAGVAVSQTIIDLTAVRNYRSSRETANATRLNVRDSRELVILAVGGSYLQVLAAAARVDSARAQVETARALYEQAVDQNKAGLNALIDVSRSQVELQTQQLRLISLETDLATQKLSLGRLIGLPLGQDFTLTTNMAYRPATVVLEEALKEALENRADLQAAAAQERAAVHAYKAATAQNSPAVTLNGDYALVGVNPAQSNGTFSVSAGVSFPIWRGGRNRADIAEADAVLAQRRAEYEDTYGRVDFEVRSAILTLTAASEQVKVAESSRALAQGTLRQARDRFAAGVADTIEVVQAQESLAVAEQDYISSLYAHHLAKLTVARATGDAEQGIADLLRPSRP